MRLPLLRPGISRIAALAALAWPGLVAAQDLADSIDLTGPVCVLHSDHPDMIHTEGSLPSARSYNPDARRTATFVVNYSGFSPQAQAAFQRAVDIWSTHISSAVPIHVQANWAPLGSGVLGAAGPTNFRRNPPNAPYPNTFYPIALAEALAGFSFNGTSADINATFNSNFGSWYLGLDGNPPSSQWDFVSVVLHELGHGLGFVGSGRVDNGSGTTECDGVSGNGCWGGTTIVEPYTYDRFVEDAGGNSMLDATLYPNPSPQLGTLLRSNQLYHDGPTVTLTLGTRGRLYAPGGWQQGSSYSHFDETIYPPGNQNALMTPFINNGEAFTSPGPSTCALFKDSGWPMGDDCAAIIVTANEEPAIARGATLERLGPNPFTGTTTLRLRVEEAQAVRAELFDALGRRVAVLFEGTVAAGQAAPIQVDGTTLPAGVYVVRVTGEQVALTERVLLTN
ncbi:MAG TPA: T9SS type A sorting domain-containing protein [Rubricoccaceae bacterium]|nr:T9SS type A sorting domain-containing protein [Rubricoccaceae bacterium]